MLFYYYFFIYHLYAKVEYNLENDEKVQSMRINIAFIGLAKKSV